MEYLLALLLILIPKADLALLVSLDELGATLDLALVVASLQLVALDSFWLTYEKATSWFMNMSNIGSS
mgnify:CR=1 FL=1